VISHERRPQYSVKTDGAPPNYAALPRDAKRGSLCGGAAQNGRIVSQICNRGATFPASCIGCASDRLCSRFFFFRMALWRLTTSLSAEKPQAQLKLAHF
jgi:hypothetical protein